ncbi:MAG: NAD(P)H-hydrate dehydratase [Bdellovibrionales bacterium]|nr:NAD(P)H-hydrate dehydratase [Bdellovibrionales bacterium]
MAFVKFGRQQARALLPIRPHTSNKSHGGRSLIIAGSRGMYGAAVLAATAAARSGSGYTTVAISDAPTFPSQRHPDFLIRNALRLSSSDFEKCAVAIGPGLGRTARTLQLLRKLLRSAPSRVVVDADALNVAAQKSKLKFPSTWILTPHEGELARLLGLSAHQIRHNRLRYAQVAQKQLGAIVLLKGFHSLICDGHRTYQIQSGNAALAKAGTGDVLTGIITGLLAQGLEPTKAACLGAYLHGFIADEWIAQRRDVLSLLASDLLEQIPFALKKLRGTKALKT